MSIENINENITIEELIDQYPESVRFLMNRGIKCLVCGEPIWGTLASSAKEKGYSDSDLPGLVDELKEFLQNNP
jgi:hypothetical protein